LILVGYFKGEYIDIMLKYPPF